MTALGEEKLQKYTDLRREFHAHAETGWTEFWTTARIAGILDSLGYEVLVGRDVLDLDSVMGRPSDREISGFIERALAQGADPGWIKKMDGYTERWPCSAPENRDRFSRSVLISMPWMWPRPRTKSTVPSGKVLPP